MLSRKALLLTATLNLLPRVGAAQERTEGFLNPMPGVRKSVEYPIENAADLYQDALRAWRPDRQRLFNFTEIRSKAEIRAMRQRLVAVSVTEKQMRKLIAEADRKVEAELARQGWPRFMVKGAVEGYVRGHAQEKNYSSAMAIIDEQYISAAQGLLDLAEEQFGKWTTVPVPAGQTAIEIPYGFKFSTSDANERYRELINAVMRAGAQQLALDAIQQAIPSEFGAINEHPATITAFSPGTTPKVESENTSADQSGFTEGKPSPKLTSDESEPGALIPPDSRVAPSGHSVRYDAVTPTEAMGSSEVRVAFSPENHGKVVFEHSSTRQQEPAPMVPYTTVSRSSDARTYYIFPDRTSGPVLAGRDSIKITGYGEEMPRVFRVGRMDAGYYDMSYFKLNLIAPHRFLDGPRYPGVTRRSLRDVTIKDITNDACVMILPASLPRGEYIVLVYMRNNLASIPVFYDFSVN